MDNSPIKYPTIGMRCTTARPSPDYPQPSHNFESVTHTTLGRSTSVDTTCPHSPQSLLLILIDLLQFFFEEAPGGRPYCAATTRSIIYAN